MTYHQNELVLDVTLHDGTPDGRCTVRQRPLNIAIDKYPRLKVSRKEDVLARNGVYVMYEDDRGDSGKKRAYVGEGKLFARLDHHVRHDEHDFWTHALVLTSSDLNAVIEEYLEARLIELAKNATLIDANQSTMRPLEPLGGDLQTANAFLTLFLAACPLLGLEELRELQDESSADTEGGKLKLGNQNAYARRIHSGEILVLNESVVADPKSSLRESLRELRKTLEKDGTLKRTASGLKFTKDYPFSSPAKAANFLSGASVNAQTSWKDERTGKTLKELYAEIPVSAD